MLTLNYEKISPDGVQLYVSRPCAQGRLFSFYLSPYPGSVGLNVKSRLICIFCNTGTKEAEQALWVKLAQLALRSWRLSRKSMCLSIDLSESEQEVFNI